MTPQLSVVVPFHGVEAYIGDCLESIRSQALHDIEVILVDDGSPDGSRAIAERFVEQDSRFLLVEQDNAGLGPARNTGTKHATAEYLAFVDSDDLVTRHGLERMVRSLHATGSSFAGGNAMRFNNSSGARQSWTHRNAFTTVRLATHILELPVLARDRMVWNKVYRRSFWDEHGYAFPPIRYEDYPVTLKAHLDAARVDVLATPVYYWRERESGDSITQQAYAYDNLLDRVVSAEMVMGVVRDTSAVVRDEVYSALVESDFVTVVQAFATVPDEHAEQLLALGGRFAEQLGEELVARSGHAFDRIQFRALMARDIPLLRELAEFRASGGLRGQHRAGRHPRAPWRREYAYPGLGSPSVPRALYGVPRSEISLLTSVSAISWVGAGLRIRGTAEIRHVPTGEKSGLRVEVGAGKVWHPVPTRRFAEGDSHGDHALVGFEVVLTHEVLNQLAATGEPNAQLRVTMQAGLTRRTDLLGGMRAGSPSWPGGRWISHGVWAQPASTPAGHLAVTWRRHPWLLTSARVDGELEVAFTSPRRVSADHVRVVLSSTHDAPEVAFDAVVDRGGAGRTVVCRLPLGDVLQGVDHDDPFQRQSTRALWIHAGTAKVLPIWAADPVAVGTVVGGTHLVRLTRSPGNRVNLIEGPVRLTVDTARLEQTGGHDAPSRLVVSGRHWGLVDAELGWRHYLPNSDDYVEARSKVSFTPERWSVSTPVPELLGDPEVGLDGAAINPRDEWVLFFSLRGRTSTAVVPEPFLSTKLPLAMSDELRRGELRPRGATLHLEVTDAIDRTDDIDITDKR